MLIDDIRAQGNDKRRFAMQRLTEEVFSDDVYGISELGTVESVESVCPVCLWKQYKELLSRARVEIFAVGHFDFEALGETFRNLFATVERGEIYKTETKPLAGDRPEVKTVYDRAAAEIGDVPVVVANDGDVTALAGAMGMGVGSIMGIAMGTSEAVGYVDKDKNVLGWISELAFAPVDLNENAMADEWSTDLGVGCKYFSQDAVIKLAPRAGITLDEALTPAEKLKVVQGLMEQDDPRAQAIFETIGGYLAYTVVQYAHFYDIKHLMVLGRVMSGKGGDTILASCQAVLKDEFPAVYSTIQVMLPDEKTRRVGQSVAAASLPELRK
jgi:predicted NBD/HSP70 family sugar kinase